MDAEKTERLIQFLKSEKLVSDSTFLKDGEKYKD